MVDLTQALADLDLSLRPIAPDDEPVLREIYASTRAEELALTDWDGAQKEAFLRMQFDLQHSQYLEHYAGASFDLLLRDGLPAGRLYVDRTGPEHLIIDIALLPAARGGGLGTGILRALQTEARTAGRPLTLYVEQFNRAQFLYRRLGFVPVQDVGVYTLMRWDPAAV